MKKAEALLSKVKKLKEDYQERLDFLNQDLKKAKEKGNYIIVIGSLLEIAKLYYWQNNFELAKEYLGKARIECQNHDDKENELICVQLMAGIDYYLGNKNDALSQLQYAIIIAKKIKNEYVLSLCLMGIAVIYLFEKKGRKAFNCFKEAIPVIRKIGDIGWEIAALQNIHSIFASFENSDYAREYLKKEIAEIKNNRKPFYNYMNDIFKTWEIDLSKKSGFSKGALSYEISLGKAYQPSAYDIFTSYLNYLSKSKEKRNSN